MAEVMYTAGVKVTGGRQGEAQTLDGAQEMKLRGPIERGGEGGGWNPEQLFAIGWAACFESSVRGNARRQQLDPTDTAIVSQASLIKAEEGGAHLSVTMDVTMPKIEDIEVAKGIVRASHQTCPYSRATRGNVAVAFTVNGVDVDGI